MTCADLIAQYEENLVASLNAEKATIGTFSLIQHWPNGQAGHGSGWLHYIGTPVPSEPDVTVYVGHANLTYDPYGRNPTVVYVDSNGGVGLGYAGGAQGIGTDLNNLECNSMSGSVVLTGTESVHAGPANSALPAYDLLTFGTFELWKLELLKNLFPALAGVAT